MRSSLVITCSSVSFGVQDDPVMKIIWDSSEEGIKVSRNDGAKYLAVYRRVPQPGVTAAKLLEDSQPLKKRRRCDTSS